MNAAHTGAVTLPSVNFPAGPAWSVQMGGTPSYALIVGGRVFVTVSLTGGGSELIALDGATGTTLWGPVKYPGLANAVYDNGRLFVINSDPFSNNYVAAYDAATILDAGTGNEVGTYTADDPPAFTATMGYFVQNGTLEGISVPGDTVQWSFKPAPASVAGAPIVVNQYVIVSSGNFGSTGAVYALDGSSGAQVWFQPYNTGTVDTAFTMSTQPQSGLAAGDGLLVVPVGTTLYGYFL